MKRQHIKFHQGCLLVLKMTQTELDLINRYINAQIAYRSIKPDKSEEDIEFLTHVHPLQALKVMKTLTLTMQSLLRDYCLDTFNEDIIGEPDTNILFGIELVNDN